MPILLKLFQKNLKGRNIPNSFYEDITLIPKLSKDITRKENGRPISLMNMDANILNKINTSKLNSKVHQKAHTS